MRQIEFADQIRVRFPGRSEEFDEGVEVGLLATLMALGERSITRTVSPRALEQLRPLAERLEYRVFSREDGDLRVVVLQSKSVRPTLSVVGN